ncbi:MAG: MFS transporter, partial [Chloroflexi bacterium]|nr:MFS transporter [Chloroflexota bacterium]
AAELLRPLLEGGEFIRFSAVTFVLRLGLYFPAGLYSVFWVRDLQASDAWIGWRTTVGNVALMVGYYFWGRVAARRGHLPVLVLATVGLGAYPLLTSLTTPSLLPLLLVAALIWGLFASGIDVSLFEGLLAVTPDDRRPHFVAMNTALANLVAFGAPIVGAAAAQQAGIPPVLFVSSVCLLASAALVVLWRQKRG